MVYCDCIWLEQVIINLLCNVIDVIKLVCELMIEIMVSFGFYVFLFVWDNGLGVFDLEKFFEFFFIIKKFGEGIGLGFVILFGIVVDFGGCLIVYNVEGDEGWGVVFEFELLLYDFS